VHGTAARLVRRDRVADFPSTGSRRGRTCGAAGTMPPDDRARVRSGIMTRKGIDMKRVMVKYKIKPDRAAENERYIQAVFAQLERDRPAGLRYASFKLDDGLGFVHIASLEAADGGNPLLALEAFQAFTAQIKDRCDEPPVTIPLNEIGSYRFFAGD
jgi:hypothetical protein